MLPILIGNLFSLAAMGTDALSASRRDPKSILLAQQLSQLFYALSALVLGGYSAVAQNAVALTRNFLAIRGEVRRQIQWLLVGLGVGLGLLFNRQGLLGLLPVLANLIYSVAVFRCGDDHRLLRLAFAVNLLLWAVFNLAIWNLVGAMGNGAVGISALLFLLRDRKKK